MDFKAIREIIDIIFEEDQNQIKKLEKWYIYTLSHEWEYVVHVVRRSYILSLVMEKYTKYEMQDSENTIYLTDGALLNLANTFAIEYAENHRFPLTLLCDDIMIHGRNVNSVLSELESGIFRYLDTHGNVYNRLDVQKSLAEAIVINVFAKRQDSNLLLSRYRKCVRTMQIVDVTTCHMLSDRVSRLVSLSGEANASYIPSLKLDRIRSSDVRQNNRLIRTNYQGIEEYADIGFLMNSTGDVVAVITTRFIKATRHDKLRAIPYVFLPSLSEREILRLNEEISRIIEDREYKYLSSDILNPKRIGSLRTCSEWITMVLSLAVLSDYTQNSDIDLYDTIEVDEIIKLTRNYISEAYDEDETFKALCEMLYSPPIGNLKNLFEILERVIEPGNILFRLNKHAEEYSEDQIKEWLENLIYNGSVLDEKQANDLSKGGPFVLETINRKFVRQIEEIFEILGARFNHQDAKTMIAFFLQMMDAGSIGISALDISTDGEMRGYMQLCRAAEQSLAIYPARLGTLLPLAIESYLFCRSRGRDYVDNLESFRKSRFYCGENIEELIRFTDILNFYGESPADWDFSVYTRSIDIDIFSVAYQNEIRELKREANIRVSNYRKFVGIEKGNVRYVRNYQDNQG